MKPELLYVDGLQLLFRHTGLALVTGELLRALTRAETQPRVAAIIPRGVDLEAYGLERSKLEIMDVRAPRLRPDYLFRAEWGRRVSAQLRRRSDGGQLFIPYFFNYGQLNRNLVLVPDFVERLLPPGADAPVPPWSLRGRLPFRRLMRRYEEWKVRRARRLIVYSRFVRDHAAEVLALPRERFTEIPLAAPHWITDAPASAPLRPELAEKLPARFVLYVGGYSFRKNLPLLLHVCARLHQLDSTFRCVFAGLGALPVGGDSAAAVLLPEVQNDDLAPLYRRAEFTVYPSLSEGFGLPVVEAGACARLCLCGDNSSMIEIQPDPRYRIDASDETAWVERILHYWQHPAEAAAAGRECELVAQGFSWDTAAEQLRGALAV